MDYTLCTTEYSIKKLAHLGAGGRAAEESRITGANLQLRAILIAEAVPEALDVRQTFLCLFNHAEAIGLKKFK